MQGLTGISKLSLPGLRDGIERLKGNRVKVYAVFNLEDVKGLNSEKLWEKHTRDFYNNVLTGYGHSIFYASMGVLSYEHSGTRLKTDELPDWHNKILIIASTKQEKRHVRAIESLFGTFEPEPGHQLFALALSDQLNDQKDARQLRQRTPGVACASALPVFPRCAVNHPCLRWNPVC